MYFSKNEFQTSLFFFSVKRLVFKKIPDNFPVNEMQLICVSLIYWATMMILKTNSVIFFSKL